MTIRMKMDRYLTLSPTGIEPFVMRSIQESLHPMYKCHIQQISSHHHHHHHQEQQEYQRRSNSNIEKKGRTSTSTETSSSNSSENKTSPHQELQTYLLQQQERKK
jgi:hypothetical protein